MIAADRIAGAICLGFSAILMAAFEATWGIAVAITSSSHGGTISPAYWAQRCSCILLVLGIGLLVKSVVSEIRNRKINAAPVR